MHASALSVSPVRDSNLNLSDHQDRTKTRPSAGSLLISPILSIGATGVVAILIKLLAGQTSWAYQFFYGRRFVQWIIVWMCLHGLVELARRIPVWLRERRGLRAWQNGGMPGPDAGLVRDRYERLQQLLECAPVVDLRAGSRRLGEQAATQLDNRYSAVNVLTHLASYCGFFGTVLGLSIGLFQAFGGNGALSLKSFGGAVSTSFDTTLSGVACTILLIMMQNLVRSREEAVLAATDQLVEDLLLHHEQEVASTLGLNGLTVSPQNHTEIYSRTVDAMALHLREATAASQAVVQQTQEAIAAYAREATSASQAVAQQAQALVEAITQTNTELRASSVRMDATHNQVEAAQGEFNQGMAQVVASANEQSGQVSVVIRQSERLAGSLEDLKKLVSRPRILHITEAL